MPIQGLTFEFLCCVAYKLCCQNWWFYLDTSSIMLALNIFMSLSAPPETTVSFWLQSQQRILSEWPDKSNRGVRVDLKVERKKLICLAKFYRVQNDSITWYPTSWGCCRVNQIRNECRCLHTSLRKSPNPTQSGILSYDTALHLSLRR